MIVIMRDNVTSSGFAYSFNLTSLAMTVLPGEGFSTNPTKTISPNVPPDTSASPPPYNEYDPAATQSSSSRLLAPPGPAHNVFGPTPLTAQIPTYAYYDARSPYSLAQADARARRRFFAALFWVLGLWFVIGCLAQIKMSAHRHGKRLGRSYEYSQ